LRVMRAMFRRWFPTLALTALLAAGCGSAATPPAGNAASVSPLAATPGVTRSLALVTLRGSDSIVVRDITDINHPTTVSNLGAISAPVFVSATEVSNADTTAMYRMPLSGSPKTVVAKQAGGMGLIAWSPDGTTAGYMAADGLHLIVAGRDRTLGEPLPVPNSGYGCESQVCADAWDSRLAFSPDGAYVSLVVLSGPVTSFRLWSSDGRLLTTPRSQGATMSVWSGQTLYFSDSSGIEAWRDGVSSQFLTGVQWVRPKASPAGGAVVYEARDGSGLAHVYVVDTATKNVRELKAGRSEPVYLTARYLWYAGERACVASDQCVTGPTVATGKTYIYDLQDGTETESIITNVYDVWPHAA